MIFNLKRPAFGEGAYSFDGSEQPGWASEGADWMMSIPVSGHPYSSALYIFYTRCQTASFC